MMKQKIMWLLMVPLGIVLMAATFRINSTGAPVASTGAPGESSCAKSGCHTGNNHVNTGQGNLEVMFMDSITGYKPGKTYTLLVRMQQTNINRFGFETTVLDQHHNSCGTFSLTDAIRTQLLQDVSRSYLTYRAEGTSPVAAGKGEWVFKWTAPAVDAGPVTIYTAAVAANDDGTDQGDLVYTKALTIPSLTTKVESMHSSGTFDVFPVPFTRVLTLSYLNAQASAVRISIYHLATSQEVVLYNKTEPQGKREIHLEKPAHLPSGIYVLVLKQNDALTTKKIIVGQ